MAYTLCHNSAEAIGMKNPARKKLTSWKTGIPNKSLGFLVVVIWIVPKINRYSVNLSITLCLFGVVVPAIIVGISEKLIIYAWISCIAGVLVGMVINKVKNGRWIE